MQSSNTVVPSFSDMKGKVALVTGGSRGIGAVTCRLLAAQGVTVFVNGRDEQAIDEVVESIQVAHGNAIAAPADCSRLADVERLRDQVMARTGAPDYLLTFAGGGTERPMPIQDISEQNWRSSLDNNLSSTFFVVKCFLPGMLQRQVGTIVTIASAGGRMASGAPAGYGAAKAGVIMFTRHLANEVGAHGIRANCVSPSAILTDRTRHSIPLEQQEKMLAAFPLRRLGQPEDVAAASLFLLSDASSWITGTVMDVAGGRVML
jgi:3-oxoacyl-[acyl-carrier protein] reductase